MIFIYFQHYLKVHAEKVFQCEKCPKGFSTEAAKIHHTRICGIKFICSCNHTYDSYEALLTHAKRSSHTFDEKFKSYGKYVLIRNCTSSEILNIAVEWVPFLFHIWGFQVMYRYRYSRKLPHSLCFQPCMCMHECITYVYW